MCQGNRAEASARYISAQLVALYENARHCAEKHDASGTKPTQSSIEYGISLYRFYGPGNHSRSRPSVRDLSFFATFDPPRLEFVCNHEVILFLNLREGHYKIQSRKQTANQYVSLIPKPRPVRSDPFAFVVHRSQYETIDDFTAAYRITFSTHWTDKFQCKEIGNASSNYYAVNFLVLDIECSPFSVSLSRVPLSYSSTSGNTCSRAFPSTRHPHDGRQKLFHRRAQTPVSQAIH